jgi:hypothetical protein
MCTGPGNDLHADATYLGRSINLTEFANHAAKKWFVSMLHMARKRCTKFLLLLRPAGTYTQKVERDWAFFWINHAAYHAHHARVDAAPELPALIAVSRRGSLVRLNADGSSLDHDVEAAVQHAMTVPLPPGAKRAHEGS